MEIFRTDGGGHETNPIRLIRAIATIQIPEQDSFWANIKEIHDHKGDLYINIINETQSKITLFEFQKAWDSIGESSYNVYIGEF